MVLELVRQNYRDFGPTLATEVLLAKHDIRVGRETLRLWMLEEGLWQSRKQRRSFHQPRLRREGYGELIQIDGSDHRWFEQRGEPCTLLVFIDDATSRLMQLRFVPSESTGSYFEARTRLHDCLRFWGVPNLDQGFLELSHLNTAGLIVNRHRFLPHVCLYLSNTR